MTVVPTAGMDWSPALLVAVAAAVADDAGADDGPALVEDPLDADPAAEFEAGEPPHAASSSTSDPIPVAAAHPLLRITSLQFARMTRSRAVMAPGPGTLKPPARDGQPAPPTMLLSDILITCHMPPTPLPLVASG